MLKTYLYLPDELDKGIEQIARREKKSKAAVLREAIADKVKGATQNSGLEAFAKLAEIGKKYNVKGPRDGSKRMDDYLWGKDWSKEE